MHGFLILFMINMDDLDCLTSIAQFFNCLYYDKHGSLGQWGRVQLLYDTFDEVGMPA